MNTIYRFMSKVEVGGPEDCWPWIGYIDRGGYGRISVGRAADRRPVLAHRWIIQCLRGPLAPGAVVMHTCDNPPCVNPLHLRVGTHADNVADKIAKGRAAWASHYASKTECIHGHQFDELNTYRTPDGRRQCRACKRVRRAAA